VDTSGDSPLDPDDDDKLFANGWAYIEADSAGSPLNVGECRRVSSYTPTTGTLTTSRAFTNATTTTQSYAVYLGAPPIRTGGRKGLQDYLNDALRGLKRRDYGLLTLVTDGDMAATGVTNWTTNGTAVAAKSATTGITGGKQSLSVTTAASGDYVRTASIPVLGGGTLSVCADCYDVSGYGCQLVVYDVTGSAALKTLHTDTFGQRYLADTVQLPSTCKQVQIRLSSVTANASAVSYWDNLSVRSESARLLPAPSWLTSTALLEDVVYRSGGSRADENEAYNHDEASYGPIHFYRAHTDGTGTIKIEYAPSPPVASHLFVRGLRGYTELSALTDTTDCDADLLKAWALVNLYTDLENRADIARWYATALALLNLHSPRPAPRAYPALRDV
jgi:hypothetical protein